MARSERRLRRSALRLAEEPSLEVESWSESIDDASDYGAHGPEIGEDQGVLRIAQRYLDGLVTLHLHLRVRPRDLNGDPHEFCAVIASRRGDVGRAADLAYVPNGDGIPGEVANVWAFGAEANGDLEALGEDTSNVDMPMFVHIVKPRKEGEIRVRRAVSELKGLVSLDDCPIIRAYTAKHPEARQIPLPAFVDGELRLPTGATAPEEHQLPNEIVERGPQVVSKLPDDESDPGIGRLPIETKDILAGIAIELTHDAAVFLVDPRLKGGSFLIERGQVLVRSFESPIDGF